MKSTQLVCIVLDSKKLHVFQVVNAKDPTTLTKMNLNFTEKTSNEIYFHQLFEIPCPGNATEIVSLDFKMNKNSEYTIIACLSDGSFFFVSIENNEEITFLKPKMPKNELIHFKVVDNENDNFLLVGTNKHLYYLSVMSDKQTNNKNLFCFVDIPGNFENGVIINKEKVAGISKDTVFVYAISYDISKNIYMFVKDNQINVHYDEITFAFIIENTFIFTASKDASIKISFTKKIKSEEEFLKFDRTSGDITRICILDSTHAFTLESTK